MTRLGIKPEFIAPEADALTRWPSELLNTKELKGFGNTFHRNVLKLLLIGMTPV